MDISELNDILKLAGLEARPIEADAPEADMEEDTLVCKHCGDKFGEPTTDCEYDCHDPEGENWEKAEEIEEWANSGDHVEGEPVEMEVPGETVDTSLRRHVGADAMPVKIEEMMDLYGLYKEELVEHCGCEANESFNDAADEMLEDINDDEVRELVLYAENDGDLYRQSTAPIQKNLSKKWTKGIYNHEAAVTLWKYHADRAAKAYGKDHGQGEKDGLRMFSPAVRKAAAKEFADQWLAELEVGNLHEEIKMEGMSKEKYARDIEAFKARLEADPTDDQAAKMLKRREQQIADIEAGRPVTRGPLEEASGEFAAPLFDIADQLGFETIVHELAYYMSGDEIERFVDHVRDNTGMNDIEEEVMEVELEDFEDVDQETLDNEFADEDLPFKDVDQETLDAEFEEEMYEAEGSEHDYGMFTIEGDEQVHTIVMNACEMFDNGKPVDVCREWCLEQLEALAENPSYEEADDTAVREAAMIAFESHCGQHAESVEEAVEEVAEEAVEEAVEEVEEAAKPDFLDLDGDGNTEEPMKKAADDKEEKEEEAEKETLNEADYEIKDNKCYIARDEFAKVHADFKNDTAGEERMMCLDPETGGTASYEVVFTD